MKRMKNGKTVSPADIEVCKYFGERDVEFLTKQFDMILDNEKMPEEWR